MAKSRYSDTPIVDGKFYAPHRLPINPDSPAVIDFISNVSTVDYLVRRGDRLDHLAARYFGNDAYWWVIAIANKIDYPFPSGGLSPGDTIKIPKNVRDVLDKIMR